jgi:hypothetical protein
MRLSGRDCGFSPSVYAWLRRGLGLMPGSRQVFYESVLGPPNAMRISSGTRLQRLWLWTAQLVGMTNTDAS